MKRSTLVVSLMAACSTGYAAASSRTTSIGGKEFRLSSPADCVDLCSQYSESAQAIALEVPPVNEFLGCYTTPADFNAWTARTGGVFESILVV